MENKRMEKQLDGDLFRVHSLQFDWVVKCLLFLSLLRYCIIETFVSFRRMMNNCCFMCISNLSRVSMRTIMYHTQLAGGACKQSNCNMHLIEMLIKWQPGKRQPCVQHKDINHIRSCFVITLSLPFSFATPAQCKKSGNRTKSALNRWQKSSERRSCEKNIDNKTQPAIEISFTCSKGFLFMCTCLQCLLKKID